MAIDYGYDVDSYEVQEVRQGLPAGVYKVICIKEGWEETSNGDLALAAYFEALEGDNQGGSIRNLYNLRNTGANAKKVIDIAQAELKKTFLAMNRTQKEGLVEGKCIIHVGLDKTGQYMNIKKFEPLDAPMDDVAAKPAKAAAKPATPSAATLPAEDDIPFDA